MKRNGKKTEPLIIEYNEEAQKEFVNGFRKRKLEKKRKTIQKYKLKHIQEKRASRLPALARKQELLKRVKEIDAIGQKSMAMESETMHKNGEDRVTIVTVSAMHDLDEFATLKSIQNKKDSIDNELQQEL